ncbi:hypothetical protein BDV29DRAFT_159267 [Aspergillus leporis]|uniref:Uncharacterized protein n=1 Tax=Aspergillus leporis TaxID=41062 RepID=A0A5N5WWT8_9EURO|nr:hypothetical protein BDV29DRAFT_159267 [Aspergillus leporis]
MSTTTGIAPTAPPMVVGQRTLRATRPTNKLPRPLINGAEIADKEPFHPNRYLNFRPPSRIYTMNEIGLEGQGISPNAQASTGRLPDMSTFVKNTIRGMALLDLHLFMTLGTPRSPDQNLRGSWD